MANKKRSLIIGLTLLIVFTTGCILLRSINSEVTETITDTPEICITECEEVLCPTVACLPGETALVIDPNEPKMIVGGFDYTNDFYPEGYARVYAVGLFDMTGFLLRDNDWVIPVESQVLGYLDLDAENNSATYQLSLPAEPQGTSHLFGEAQEGGVQIFAIEFAPNWTGGPFYVDNDEYQGWPGYLASVVTDRDNQSEVIGGKLIIWANDDQQQFPSGYGEDGLLFTDDDPLMAVPKGYAVIDLDSDPFAIIRQPVPEVILLEPQDAAVKDFSAMTYTEAFNNMFDILSLQYAFNGIAGKQPDWDSLYAAVYPQVEAAQANRNAYAFYLALREFAMAFTDGHVGVSGGDLEGLWVQENMLGGYGMAIRELDDGKVLVVYILEGGPAQQAGIQRGAEIVSLRGLPVGDAINQTEPYSPQSTDFGLRYEQTVFVMRDAMGASMEIGYINPGQSGVVTVELDSMIEFDSLWATYLGGEFDEFVLPIEYKVLQPEGIGYVKVNSNSDDLNLGYTIFERAMEQFSEAGVRGVILDLRRNFGGTPYNLAGYLTDQEISMGILKYYNENTGTFEPRGDDEETIYTPMVKTYSFPSLILLVDQFCYSACELESYALSQVPGMVVMGYNPTAGVEAETARGKFDLPGGISFSAPTGRFELEDGSILLEGVGVVPDIRLPITAESVLSSEDLVLQRAVQRILTGD